MIKVLNTKETSKMIMKIIENAKEDITIISPYLDMSKKYKKALDEKKINIDIVYGKNILKLEQEDYMFLSKNISIYFCENLHAKIYINEKEGIISSMNLYKFSEKNNFEISVYFTANENIWNEVISIVNEIFENSEIDKISTRLNKSAGYCIRTGVKIDFNPEKPFCYEAWKEWSKWQNPLYPEKFCHYSGKPSNGKTNFANPIL